MARNLGVLIRQTVVLGNRSRPKPCFPGLVHHWKLLSDSIQTLNPKLPFSYSLQYSVKIDARMRHPGFTDIVLSRPSNVLLASTQFEYFLELKHVQDKRLSAVFFYTAPGCWATSRWITPIFHDLCEQFRIRNITICMVYMGQNVGGHTLNKLGVCKTPTFHFYLKGEKVDELASASVPRLKKILANVFNPSGLKKRRTRAKEDTNDDGVYSSQLVEVLPSRFPVSSIPKVMDAVESLPEGDPDSKLWWFAKGLFDSREKREVFSSIEDVDHKLEWLNREIAEE